MIVEVSPLSLRSAEMIMVIWIKKPLMDHPENDNLKYYFKF